MLIKDLGTRWVEIGDEYHIWQFICTINLGERWCILYDLNPSNKPVSIIMGAKNLNGDLKLGSKTGVIKSQFTVAPPMMAIIDSVMVLRVCLSLSDEYWLGGL